MDKNQRERERERDRERETGILFYSFIKSKIIIHSFVVYKFNKCHDSR